MLPLVRGKIRFAKIYLRLRRLHSEFPSTGSFPKEQARNQEFSPDAHTGEPLLPPRVWVHRKLDARVQLGLEHRC